VKKYGFVSVVNYPVSAVGDTPAQALRNYRVALTRSPSLKGADDLVTDKRVETTVVGVVSETQGDNTTYYLLLAGEDGKEFFAGSNLSPELKWTKKGDTVVATFAEGAQEVSIALSSFDNLGLELQPVN